MPRNLIVFCDGTWKEDNVDDNTPEITNIAKAYKELTQLNQFNEAGLFEALDGKPQVLYYGAGVGVGDRMDRMMGGLTGSGIEKNIQEAYQFLVNNYKSGDQIYLFGFSRGAYYSSN